MYRRSRQDEPPPPGDAPQRRTFYASMPLLEIDPAHPVESGPFFYTPHVGAGEHKVTVYRAIDPDGRRIGLPFVELADGADTPKVVWSTFDLETVGLLRVAFPGRVDSPGKQYYLMSWIQTVGDLDVDVRHRILIDAKAAATTTKVKKPLDDVPAGETYFAVALPTATSGVERIVYYARRSIPGDPDLYLQQDVRP